MPGVDGITHEAAALFRFVESIKAFCSSQSGFAAYYPEGSRDFLCYVEQLADCTKAYLEACPKNVPSNHTEYRVYRQGLRTLRLAWHYVHRVVKPVADAHTLHLPASLIDSLQTRLRSIPHFAGSKLVILHIRELNYLQVFAGNIQRKLTEIADLVAFSKPFPQKLGLIGIPYSQAKSVFTNSLVAHEIGHFAFEAMKYRDVFAPKITVALDTAIKPVIDKFQTDEARRMVPGAITSWFEELFCDLFAVALVGPCYSYAFTEIFDLSSHLDIDSKINLKFAAPQLLFNHSHPAHFYRLQKQAEMLSKLGWWSRIETSKCDSQTILARCRELPSSSFSFPFSGAPQKCFIEALDLLMAELISAVQECTSGLDHGLSDYESKLSNKVLECFVRGIVPSAIVNPTSGKPVGLVTVLNVAYNIYLEHLHELLERIVGQNAMSAKDRTWWTEKLEQWTLKALGDIALISAKATGA